MIKSTLFDKLFNYVIIHGICKSIGESCIEKVIQINNYDYYATYLFGDLLNELMDAIPIKKEYKILSVNVWNKKATMIIDDSIWREGDLFFNQIFYFNDLIDFSESIFKLDDIIGFIT